MFAVAVRQLLKLPSLRGSVVAAGRGGLDREVGGVNVMEVPDIESFVKPGELLLTTTYPLRKDPASLTGLVRMLDRLSLAALAVKPGRYLDDLPDEMLALADQLDFPVILLPRDASFNVVIEELLAVVLMEHGADPTNADVIRERLTGVALAGGGHNEIARTLAGALERQVEVVDTNGAVLGWGDVGLAAEAGRWSFPVSVGGMERGRIVVHGKEEPSLGQRRLIQQACFATGMHVAQAIARLELDSQMRVLFLEELVATRPLDEFLVRERSRLFGWDLSGDWRVILTRMDREFSDTAAAATARMLHPDCIAWARGRELVILLPSDQDNPNWDVQALVGQWHSLLVGVADPQVTVAVGSVARTPGELARSHADARESLAIAPSIGRQVVLYDLLTLERVIRSVPGAMLAELIEASIGPLIRADNTGASNLCGTLEMFLGARSAADAAQQLFIHYNTMKHRMSRIAELLPGDLHDPTIRLAAAFALQARKLLSTGQ